jgi:hypothetical protein
MWASLRFGSAVGAARASGAGAGAGTCVRRAVRRPAECVPSWSKPRRGLGVSGIRASSGGGSGVEAGSSLIERAVARINYSFEHFPREALGCMFAAEILSIYGTHSLLVASGVSVPAEFALAFAMGRPLRRVRFPAEVLLAATLCRAMPALGRIKIAQAMAGATPEAVRSGWGRASPSVRAAVGKIGAVVDSYGAAYFIAARWTGVAVVLGLYGGIELGLDVSGALDRYGLAGYGTVLGTWAAAVVLSSACYPLTIAAGAAAAVPVGHLVRRAVALAARRK